MLVAQAILGLIVFHLAVWWFSEARGAVRWRTVIIALVLQVFIAWALVGRAQSDVLFGVVNTIMSALTAATAAGTGFVFGYLGGAEAPFEITRPEANFILALQALPIIVVMSALARLLTFWRILPFIVGLIATAVRKTLGIGGALGLAAAANLFVGMIESPLFIRGFIARMQRGELLAMMVCGMATIAGTVFVLYANILEAAVPGAAGHLLTASLMSLPAALALSLILIPLDEAQLAPVAERETLRSEDVSAFDAITAGTRDGLSLFFNVVAMLLVLVALVQLVNLLLGTVNVFGEPFSLERALGFLLAPAAWLLGIPSHECVAAGALLGKKVVLNELLAYLDLAQMSVQQLSDHSRVVLTYALCGFANLGSMGMLVGGLTVLAPERRQEIVALGVPALILGVLATCSTGAVVGLVT